MSTSATVLVFKGHSNLLLIIAIIGGLGAYQYIRQALQPIKQ
jgi:hypothetical protein